VDDNEGSSDGTKKLASTSHTSASDKLATETRECLNPFYCFVGRTFRRFTHLEKAGLDYF
jgi:hypothetical protein